MRTVALEREVVVEGVIDEGPHDKASGRRGDSVDSQRLHERDQDRVVRRRAERADAGIAYERGDQASYAVPPTVKPSILSVG